MSVTLQGETDNFSVFLSLIHDQVPVTEAKELRISGLSTAPTARIELAFYLLLQPKAVAQTNPVEGQKETK